ncbi:MAG: asparaginase [Actinobacteria bacterium]|nr:MAG: asparaginase [Actinomycetota bacterium]
MRRVDAIVVETRRGGIVEAQHVVHAVAVADGAVVAYAGNPSSTCYLRSSSKPLQALPLARARDDVDDRDLAIASASHRATDDQIAAVRALLAKAPAAEDELELGPQPGRPPGKIFHNCSGKHAGMLALCRARHWDSRGYSQMGHPVQEAMLAVHAEAAAVDAAEIPAAVDGCGVQTFALPLERMAYVFARLEQLDGGGRVPTALTAS